MEIQLNDYHKKVNAQMQKSMAYWREHPLSLEECLAQFKRLREQRNVCQAFLVFPQCPTIATFRKALITLPSTWFVSSETYS